MGGAKYFFERLVIFGVLVGILDKKSNGASGASAFKNSRKKGDFICFFSWRYQLILTWPALIKSHLNAFGVYWKMRRKAFYDATNCHAVRLPKSGEFENLTIARTRHKAKVRNLDG